MLSAGLSVLSLSVLIGADAHKKDIRRFLLSGILAGLAYVIRYTAAAPGVLSLVFLAGRALFARGNHRWARVGCFWGIPDRRCHAVGSKHGGERESLLLG